MQGIDREIAANYGFEARSMAPCKEANILYTDKGRKIVKKLMLSPERIMFIHGAKEHLISKGFVNVDRYLTTSKGDPYLSYDNANYVLYDFIEGRECNFDNDIEVRKAAILLAAMHSASRGYKPSEGVKIQDDLGKTPGYFSKRLEDIKKLKKHANKGKSRFDHLFLEYADYFIGLGEQAVSELEKSNYDALVEKARVEGIFCHHDLNHHNLILSEDLLSVVNFDYCCFELKIYDLANLIRRKMRKCSWDADKAKQIIEGYTKIEQLSKDEFKVMKLILQFPQKFWRVVNKYYNSRRSWSEKSYVVKLQEVIDEIAGHRIFIDKYNF